MPIIFFSLQFTNCSFSVSSASASSHSHEKSKRSIYDPTRKYCLALGNKVLMGLLPHDQITSEDYWILAVNLLELTARRRASSAMTKSCMSRLRSRTRRTAKSLWRPWMTEWVDWINLLLETERSEHVFCYVGGLSRTSYLRVMWGILWQNLQ